MNKPYRIPPKTFYQQSRPATDEERLADKLAQNSQPAAVMGKNQTTTLRHQLHGLDTQIRQAIEGSGLPDAFQERLVASIASAIHSEYVDIMAIEQAQPEDFEAKRKREAYEDERLRLLEAFNARSITINYAPQK